MPPVQADSDNAIREQNNARDIGLCKEGVPDADLLEKDISGVAVGVKGNQLINVPLDKVQEGREEHAADNELARLVGVMAVMNKR